MFGCMHKWSFPRRRDQFDGQRNVDVQTCTACGTQRVSPVQFGNAVLPRVRREPAPVLVFRAVEEA